MLERDSPSLSLLSDAQIGYFLAEAAYLLPVWVGWWILGPGRAYGAIYGFFGTWVLLSAVRVSWTAIRGHKYRFRAVAISSVLVSGFTHLAVVGLPEIHWWDVVCLVEASGFLLAGTLLFYAAPYTPTEMVNRILGLYWLGIAGFNFGFILHYPKWLEVNVYLPQIMEIVAFNLISLWLMYHPARSTRQAGRISPF